MIRIFSLILLYCATTMSLFGQQKKDPSLAFQYAQRVVKEKFKLSKTSIEALLANPALWQDKTWKAQHVNPKAHDRSADILIGGEEYPESETHAAINPADTANIIAAAIGQDTDNENSPLDIPVYYTTDFGKAWKTSNITFLPGGGFLDLPVGGGDPVLSFEKNGKAVLTWLAASLNLLDTSFNFTIYGASSTNKGASWSTPFKVETGKINIFSLLGGGAFQPGSLVDKQWISTDKSTSANEGRTYVAYVKFDFIDSVTSSTGIYLKSKPKTSNTFSTAVKVHKNDYDIAQFSSIEVDNKGVLHVMFFAGNSGGKPALYYTSSSDGGKTFLPEVKVSNFNMDGLVDGTALDSISGIILDRMYPCPHLATSPKVANTIYATWTANGIEAKESEGFDVWFTKSTDGGKNWAKPYRVNPGSNPLAEQYYGAISVNANGVISLSYYDRTEDPNGSETHYVVALSKDNGNTFAPAQKVSSASSDFELIGDSNDGFGIGEYNGTVSTNYYTIPVWSDGRSNDGNVDVYAAIVPLSGSVSTIDAGTVSDLFAMQIPNPAKGSIDVRVELKEQSSLKFEVVAADGRTVWSKKLADKQTAGEYTWNVSLAKGAYFARLYTDFGWKVQKVVVE